MYRWTTNYLWAPPYSKMTITDLCRYVDQGSSSMTQMRSSHFWSKPPTFNSSGSPVRDGRCQGHGILYSHILKQFPLEPLGVPLRMLPCSPQPPNYRTTMNANRTSFDVSSHHEYAILILQCPKQTHLRFFLSSFNHPACRLGTLQIYSVDVKTRDSNALISALSLCSNLIDLRLHFRQSADGPTFTTMPIQVANTNAPTQSSLFSALKTIKDPVLLPKLRKLMVINTFAANIDCLRNSSVSVSTATVHQALNNLLHFSDTCE